MSQTLSIQLSDDAYAAVRLRAEQSGTSPSEFVATTLERQFAATNGEGSVGPERVAGLLQRHFGAVNLGYPTGADNEQIDADLVMEFANNHEDS